LITLKLFCGNIKYVEKHVGGETAIMRYAGQDNTKPFHGDQHPLKAAEVLDEVSRLFCLKTYIFILKC
jgi:hypothetical protein